MKATQQDLQTRISDFKKTLITHQKLMADVGALLRSIGKLHDFFYKLYLPNLIVKGFYRKLTKYLEGSIEYH